MQKKEKKAEFWIVGDIDHGNNRSVSLKEIDAWKKLPNVKFLGFQKDIAKIYSKTNIACLPSYREGLPKSLVEAAAAGRAIVTTDVPGCRDSIKPNKTGLLVPINNAKLLAKMLDENPNISKVYYPGLESHPSHEIAKNQMKDFGAMMSFDLNKNIDVYKFLKNLKVIKPGMSLAGVETTVNFPMKTSHGLLTQDERDNQGIGNKLIRLSVGIESYEDLYNDLDQAIKNSSE